MDTELIRAVSGRYGRIKFFANDIGAAGRSLELYGEWAENELDFVRQFIQPGSIVLDIGTYIGTHTLAFARFVGNEGCVIAFEPLPTTFHLLRENMLANHLSNVRLENAAVADRAGSVEIPVLDISNAKSFGTTSLKKQPIKALALSEQEVTTYPKTAEVPVVTIDSLGLSKCSLIKIDAEGMESAVIRGAADTIRLLAPAVYAECNSVADGLKSLKQLRELGYEVRLHVVDAFSPNNFFGVQENIFGRAREVALVGVPSHQIDRLDALMVRPCELLVRVNRADDLVLGLLNKPQYGEEILRHSAAAGSGGAAWLDEIAGFRAIREQLESEMNWAKGAIAEERAQGEQRAQALAEALRAIRERLEETERQLELNRIEVNNQAALFEAAMRQAQFARDIADEASFRAADEERDKELTLVLQAELLTRIDTLIQQRTQCERQLDAVYASTSWRLTGPARTVVERLRWALSAARSRN